MYNAVAENVLGTIGTILWCIQLVPQIIRNYYVKDCEGVPSVMMFLWALSGVPFSIYFFGTDGSIPLRVQPQLFTLCCVITWIQTLYYPPVQCGLRKVIIYASTFIIIAAGAEVGFILWLRPIYREGKEWPLLIIVIIAALLIALGLIPPYFELAKRRGRVIGINFVFVSMDSLGAIFSLVSIVVGTMDILSIVLYAIVIALEFGIFASHTIWYIRFGKKEKAKENNQERDHEQEQEAESAYESSQEYSQEHLQEHSKEHSQEHSKEHSQEHSQEHENSLNKMVEIQAQISRSDKSEYEYNEKYNNYDI